MCDVTQILSQIEQGDGQAAEKLLPLVYDELRKLAAAKMAQEKPGQTLQATALVHEAYIRLVDVDKAQHWDSRGHFFVGRCRGHAADSRRSSPQSASAECAVDISEESISIKLRLLPTLSMTISCCSTKPSQDWVKRTSGLLSW